LAFYIGGDRMSSEIQPNLGDLKNDLAELERSDIKHSPFGEVPKEQIKKALQLLEEYAEEQL
jgi:hypothetical protein